MHLQVAEQIRQQVVDEPQGNNGRLPELLETAWPAFYLGHIAPDFSPMDQLSRYDTHFYPIPLGPEDDAIGQMLSQYPGLQNGRLLPPHQAIFLSGYLAHLLLDMVWYRDILIPYFHQRAVLGPRKQRQIVHFLLLTYLDRIAYEQLPETAADDLYAAQPTAWLPFGTDEGLKRWRDVVARQLRPGAPKETAEIYARRINVPLLEFNQRFEDPDWMNTHIFQHIPLPTVEQIIADAVSPSIDLIARYLQ